MGASQCAVCQRCAVSQSAKPARLSSTAFPADEDESEAVEGADGPETSAAGLAKVGARFRGALNKAGKNFNVGKPNIADIATQARRRQEKLWAASRSGNFNGVVDAVADGAEVDRPNLRGQTALMFVAATQSKEGLEVMKFLLDAASNIEAKDENGWTPLLHCSRNGRLENVKFLLDHGASVKVKATDGKTVLMLSAMDGADQLVMHLVKAKAQIDKKDEDGWTVLCYAARDKRRDLVKWLLDRTANPKERTKDGTTPLCIAAETGDVKVGKMLIKKGAHVNAKTSHGLTPLMYCLREHHEDFAKWLLEEMCDVGIKNHDGQTAIDLAEDLGMTAMRGRLEMTLRRELEDKKQGDEEKK